MKYRFTFKTPDVLDRTITDLLEGHAHDQRDDVEAEVRAVAEKYIQYGEYVTIVVDTETGAATVAENR